MRYGVCFGIETPEKVTIAKQSGFDYVECGFCSLSRGDNAMFQAFVRALKQNDILCEASNGFIPRDLKTVGPYVNEQALKDYIARGMDRGANIGLKTVVFGSGASRAIPEGTSYYDAFCQLAYFLGEIVSPIAGQYSIRVVTEPLRKNETNIIHTVKEGVMLAAFTQKSNVGGLADLYHMLGEGDTLQDVRDVKGSLWHAHISNPVSQGSFKRIYPANENEYDYQAFIDAITFAGCQRCSVEANCSDFSEQAPLAAKVLKKLK